MKLRSQQEQWEQLGRTDALWAILTDPEKKNGRWDEGEFFATGQAEISRLMARASELGLPAARQTALDFGCGVGRLTQPLAEYFHQVTGVDIASSMLEKARSCNGHGERCRYVLNTENHLHIFPDACFDLVYSNITLQHLPRRHIRAYLAEFVRVLRPGGLLVFQLPDHRYSAWKHWIGLGLYQFARLVMHRRDLMEMHGLPRRRVVTLLEAHGAQVLKIEENSAAGREWLSWRFFATRG